ncbi:YheT family hydrolase [Reichenbachiella versicolor]|uniref:YheT family hydrolase n=1 Tax=Reichenbachiella versicolor TaxID=1821036 RepID=UPI000D6DEA02|nr:alpha/beta fold hydrolase [Reichenbachiella versicolor]
MPIINFSSYGDFLYPLRNGHWETIIPSVFGKKFDLNYDRERIETPDDDFLDLDWVYNQSEKLVIISHGLEGSSNRPYVRSMAKYMSDQGYDVCAWNYRSCSGDMNRQLRLYHHGVTDDLETVIKHCVDTRRYKKIALIGFSMGGSTTLKYIGEQGTSYPKQLVAAATFSVPCHLWDSALELTSWRNTFYRKRFLKKLIDKIKRKSEQFPGYIDTTDIDKIKSFGIFDERFTAPLHGFKSARHFYKDSSSDLYYNSIKIPSLIVNALNDPMLGERCFPIEQCRDHQFLFLEMPKSGGHVGFSRRFKKHNWMDIRAHQFISEFMEE